MLFNYLHTVTLPVLLLQERREELEDDTFEIVSGAINYVGDWEMRITFIFTGHADSPTYNNTWSVDIQQNTKSLERLFDLFPEYTARYPISLSMMGKEAISLQDFLKLVETNSN